MAEETKLQKEFYEDLSYIGQTARGYIVREIYEKWKDKIREAEE